MKAKAVWFLIWCRAVAGWEVDSRVINGTIVPEGQYPEMILITTEKSWCSSTLIGPRVILTAAHCARVGSEISYTHQGITYRGIVAHSPRYAIDYSHDIAVAAMDQENRDIKPATVGGKAFSNTPAQLLGFGCTAQGGGYDKKLRVGNTRITSYSGYYMYLRGGGIACPGDSGGAAFVSDNGERYLLGVTSRTDFQSGSYSTRLDVGESESFLRSFGAKHNVDICGINSNC